MVQVTLDFLQSGRRSSHPANSVKVLKVTQNTWLVLILCVACGVSGSHVEPSTRYEVWDPVCIEAKLLCSTVYLLKLLLL